MTAEPRSSTAPVDDAEESRASTSERRPGGRILTLSVAIGLASVVVLSIASFRWPRSWDASVLEYAAWAINQGSRPYRDVFDMNYPGSLLFYGVGQRVLGSSDLSFRIRDVAVLGIALVALYRLMRRFAWPAAPFAVIAVGTYYLVVGGLAMSLQRDWLVTVCILVATVLLAGERPTWKLVSAGLLLGAATTIKPNAAPIIVVLPSAFALADLVLGRSSRTAASPGRPVLRRELVRIGFVVLGAAITILGAILWVIWSGGWSDFVWMNRHYLPLYARLDGDGIETGSSAQSLWNITRLTLMRPEFPPLVLGSVVVLLRRRPHREARLLLVLLAVMAVGIAQAILAGKGWDYHHLTWMIAALCFFAAGAADVHQGHWRPWGSLPRWLPVVASLAYVISVVVWFARVGAVDQLTYLRLRHLALLVTTLPVAALALRELASLVVRRPLPALRRPIALAGTLLVAFALVFNAAAMLKLARQGTVAPVPATEHELAGVLREHGTPGARVQILGTVGGHEAALEAEAPPATSFIYDFHFFHDVGSPVTDELRHRFIEEWRQRPPDLVILYKTSWSHRQTYEDLKAFPELMAELDDYQTVFSNEDARVLQRRPDS